MTESQKSHCYFVILFVTLDDFYFAHCCNFSRKEMLLWSKEDKYYVVRDWNVDKDGFICGLSLFKIEKKGRLEIFVWGMLKSKLTEKVKLNWSQKLPFSVFFSSSKSKQELNTVYWLSTLIYTCVSIPQCSNLMFLIWPYQNFSFSIQHKGEKKIWKKQRKQGCSPFFLGEIVELIKLRDL